MTNKILVTYSSRTGWTPGVAEAIGKTLTENSFQVDVIPMLEVQSLSTYNGVVAGSAIRSRAWLPEAVQFIRAHQDELRVRPFAAFLVCMTLAMPSGENYRSQISTWLDPVRALVKPVSTGLFAGGLDISRVENFSDRLMFKLSVMFGVWKEGDHRDWNAIHQWAIQLKPLLLNYSE
ncbi:MAG TPA: flavodoxin domain-containing protein [Anaerolineales bacterium]|nr:flavodoxin domain-containing protein [Anaerolineales bacterium]HNQ95618.1 flavodoxin domain-containing protein [Anaerolineales bacterium]HNS59628.1 flavodoxin domain-containing protein [Anaerolineales bacterium]